MAPNDRVTLIARLQETLSGGEEIYLSTQDFADDTAAEAGYRYLSSLCVEDVPVWRYDVCGVCVKREVALAFEEDTVAVRYTVENRSKKPCTLTIRPLVLGFEKGHAPEKEWPVAIEGNVITAADQSIYLHTDGTLTAEEPEYLLQAYRHDAPTAARRRGWLPACAGLKSPCSPVKRGRCPPFSPTWKHPAQPGNSLPTIRLVWPGSVPLPA